MSLKTFQSNNSNKKNNTNKPGSKEVDFLQGMSDQDLGPKPSKSKGFSKSRFNDSLFATGPSPAAINNAKKPANSEPSAPLKTNFNKPKPAANLNRPAPVLQKSAPSEEPDNGNSEEDHSFVLNQTVVKDNPFIKIFDQIKDFIKKKMPVKKDKALELNLVKDQVVKYFDWQKNIVYLLAVVVFAFSLLIFFYWGISWWGNKLEYDRSSAVLQDYYNISKQVRGLEGELEDITAFQQELNVVNSLLDKHVYWTNFFDFLEKNTLADVYFLNFSGNTDGEYSLSGQARSFNVLDAQVKKFLEHEDVISAKIDRGSVSGGKSVSFSLDFSLAPGIFIK